VDLSNVGSHISKISEWFAANGTQIIFLLFMNSLDVPIQIAFVCKCLTAKLAPPGLFVLMNNSGMLIQVTRPVERCIADLARVRLELFVHESDVLAHVRLQME
jgi:hypothetical protein